MHASYVHVRRTLLYLDKDAEKVLNFFVFFFVWHDWWRHAVWQPQIC